MIKNENNSTKNEEINKSIWLQRNSSFFNKNHKKTCAIIYEIIHQVIKTN